MKSFRSRVSVVAFVAFISACSFLKSNEAVLTADGEQLAECIVAEAISGDTSASAIGVKCGAPVGFDVLGFVTGLLTKLSAPTDAGVAGGPLFSAKADLIAALKTVH